MTFAAWIECLKLYVETLPEGKNPFPEFYRKGDELPEGKKVGDSLGLGSPAEQIMAGFANAYNTAKISKPKMSEWSEASVLAYCAKNIVKVAAEAKTQQQKTDDAVGLVKEELATLALKLITLEEGSKEWLAIKAQFEAFQSVKIDTAEEA